MTPYSQTQRSPWTFAILIPTAAFIIVALVAGDTALRAIALVAGAFIVALLLTFGSLNVMVDEMGVRVAFGVGWPKRFVAMGRIVSIGTVRNHWYYGWGIRKVPSGWLWNVWGLDAVELTLDSGKVLRVGTGEPDELAAAIQLRRGARP